MKVSILVCALGAAALCLGCGGGGGGGPAGVTVDLVSRANLDGFVTAGGTVDADGGGPVTGDVDGGLGEGDVRQFYTFNRVLIPAGATIVSATLRLYQADAVGNPIAKNGPIVVDYLHYGPVLEASDFDLAPLQANIGTISTSLDVGWRTLDVTAQVRDAVAAGRDPGFRLRCDYTVRILDGVDDFVAFTDVEDSCCGVGLPPIVRVVYTP